MLTVEGKQTTQEALSLWYYWSGLSQQTLLQATVWAARHEEGMSSPHHVRHSWCGAAAAGKEQRAVLRV